MSSPGAKVKSSPGLPVVPPRRWLMDRIRGRSKFGNKERPCGPCCWVPPVVGWCPGLWEENRCCTTCGKCGSYTSESSRFWCLHFGFFANILACLCMAYSCLAISQDYSILSQASFGSIVMTEKNGLFDDEIHLDIGLRAIALDNPLTGVDETVIGFDTFCALDETGLQRYVNPSDCQSCDDHSLNFVIAAILCVISFVPTFFTDILRMFSGYDVNCQKCFGVVFSMLTVLLAMNVLFTWKFLCGDTFYKNEIYLDINGNRLFPGDPSIVYTIDYEYKWGWGMLTLVAGAALKFLEVVTHCCVPTPNITRDHTEKRTYEVVDEEELRQTA